MFYKEDSILVEIAVEAAELPKTEKYGCGFGNIQVLLTTTK
jgi:hypothetical protein